MAPEITRIKTTEFSYSIENLAFDENGFNLVYDDGGSINRTLYGIQIQTDVGVTGEYVGGNSPAMAQINTFADYLIGKNPLHRERHWSEIKRKLRKYDRMGIGPIDIALCETVNSAAVWRFNTALLIVHPEDAHSGETASSYYPCSTAYNSKSICV